MIEEPAPGAAIEDGLKLADTPAGIPLAESEIRLSKPPEIAAVMVELALPPSAAVTDVGFAESAKPGLAVIVRVTLVVLVSAPPVPAMTMVETPGTAVVAAESVRIDDPDPGAAMPDGVNCAVTPDGKPLTASEIAELKPSKAWAVTVAVPELGELTVSESGLASIEKLPLLPDQGVPPAKSLIKVRSMDARIAGSETISPSSRFLVSEALEKFSEPMKTWASGLP